MSTKDLRGAVRELRVALGRTQTQFGQLIGKGLATIQRYETLVPPKGAVLAMLGRLAEENGRHDLSVIFHSALAEELGESPESSSHLDDAVWIQAIKTLRQHDPETWNKIGKIVSDALQRLIRKESDPIRYNQLETVVVLVRKSVSPARREIERLARNMMIESPGLKSEDAVTKLISVNPQLYEQSLSEDLEAARDTQFERGSDYGERVKEPSPAHRKK